MERAKNSSYSKIYIMTNTEEIDANIIEKFAKIMPKDRKEKYYKIKEKNKKTNYVLAYIILWFALEKNNISTTAPRFKYEKNFKPSLIDNNKVFFNISHTKSAVVCAISSNPIGVDIEKKRNISIKLAKKICTKKEYLMFSKAKDKNYTFFFIWTRKESFCKKNGNSIFTNFNKINSFSLKNTLTFTFENFIISCHLKTPSLSLKNISFENLIRYLK